MFLLIDSFAWSVPNRISHSNFNSAYRMPNFDWILSEINVGSPLECFNFSWFVEYEIVNSMSSGMYSTLQCSVDAVRNVHVCHIFQCLEFNLKICTSVRLTWAERSGYYRFDAFILQCTFSSAQRNLFWHSK